MWFPKHGIAIRRIASRDKKARLSAGLFYFLKQGNRWFYAVVSFVSWKSFFWFLQSSFNWIIRKHMENLGSNLRPTGKKMPFLRQGDNCVRDSKCLSGSPCRSWRFSWQHSWNIHDANATTDLNVMQEVDGIRVYYTFMLQSLLPPPVWKKSVIWKGFMWMGFHL